MSPAAQPETAPLVSVVIPAHNSRDFIAETLDSVLAQDYPAIEVIVVDDGSSDDTCEITARYAPRVSLLRQSHQGAAAARNRGIAASSGAYVAFIDADDVWWPRKLSTQVAALRGSGHGLAYGRFIRWRADTDGRYPPAAELFAGAVGAERSEGPFITGFPYVELLQRCIVWTSTVLVERAALERAGLFDPSLQKGQDYDLWLRLSQQVSMLAQETPMALYRIHGNSISHKAYAKNYEYDILQRTVARFGLEGPDGRCQSPRVIEDRFARLALNHGLQHLRTGDPNVALASLGRAIRHGGLRAKPGLLWLGALSRCVVLLLGLV